MDSDQYFDSLPPQERPIFDQAVGGFVIPSRRDLGAFPRSYKHALLALARNRGLQLSDAPELLAEEGAQH